MPEVDVAVRGLEPLRPLLVGLLIYVLALSLLWLLLRGGLRSARRTGVRGLLSGRGGCGPLFIPLVALAVVGALWMFGILDLIALQLAPYIAAAERLPRALWMALALLLLALILLTARGGRSPGPPRRR